MPDVPDSFLPINRFVVGGGLVTADDERDLLHHRLRACVVVMTAVYFVFLIQGSFAPGRRTVGPTGQGLLGGLLVIAAGLLNGRNRPSVSRLRAIETVLFGGLAAYISLDLYASMRGGLPDSEVEVWRVASFFKSDLAHVTILIFVYAIFIPNDWRRASAMIAAMAFSPLLAAGVLYATHAPFRRLVGVDPAMTLENLGEHVLILASAAAAAVYGVWTVHGYRREAARQREMNQYRLGARLGAGGMGEVYAAEHHLLKRPCAVKVISPKVVADRITRTRFEREVRATARLSHWNTVEVYDYGRTEDGEFYYVMEYLPGLSLQELVDRYGPLPPARVIYLLRQVCEALREAHLAGLIHRDLKPPNIFAANRGARFDVAKVLDFGLVKSLHDDDSALVTLEGVVTGSPLYMAPELILKNRIPNVKADLYSLGAVAYFLLVGRAPFLGPDAMAVMMAHVHDEVEPLGGFGPDVPADLEAVVLRLLAKNPDDRFADAPALEAALATCSSAPGWSAAHAEAWWAEHHPIADVSRSSRESESEFDPRHSATLVRADFSGIETPGTLGEDEGEPPFDPSVTIRVPPPG